MTEAAPEQPMKFGFTVVDRLDYIANELRLQRIKMDRIEDKIDAIGQLSTNTDAFCKEVREAIVQMRGNPMMRAMLPDMNRAKPSKVPGLIVPNIPS